MNVIARLSTRSALWLGAGVLMLGLGMFVTTSRCSCGGMMPRAERWVLVADRDPQCYYGSSWNDGDLLVAHQPQAVTSFTHRYHHTDDCMWDVVETLIPDGPNHYRYQYDEAPTSCAEGATPVAACPLTGSVVVIPLGE